MNSCREFALDDLMAITAIPVDNLPAGDPASPVNSLKPVVDRDWEFLENDDDVIVIGMRASVGTLVPIKRDTGKAKDDEGDSVAGRAHTVSVSCEVDDREHTAWNDLLRLEQTPRHLLLTFRGGQQAFVSATEDTYQCTVERNGGKTSVAFKIQNLMGLQILGEV